MTATRSPAANARSTARSATRPPELVPDAVECERRRVPLAPPGALRRCHRGSAPRRHPAAARAAQRVARPLDADRGRADASAAESRAAGVRTPARARPTPGTPRAGVARDVPCRARSRGRPPRQRSSRCSASTTAVPHSSLSRRRTRRARRRRRGRAATSARRAARPAGARQRRPSATRCSSPPAARWSTDRAGPRSPARAPPPPPRARPPPDRVRGSPAGTRARRGPSPSRSASWGPGRACRRPRDLAGPFSRVSSPATRTRPANVPPWKCGTSPRGAQQRRLPGSAHAGDDHEFALLDAQVDAAQRPARRGVGVADRLELEDGGHGSIPRRLANGASAATPSASARPACSTSGAALSVG